MEALCDRFADRLEPVGRDTFVSLAIEIDGNGRISREDVFAALGDRLEIPRSLAVEMLNDFEIHFTTSCQPFPGTREMLSELRGLGLPMGIITNGPTIRQRAKIEALGIESYFGAILISEAEGVRKPEASIFQRAAARLGVKPSTAVFIGDSAEADIGGARGSGMRAVWIRQPEVTSTPPADAIIDRVTDVLPLVRRWIEAPPSADPIESVAE